jgi:hypothetical protein
MRQRLLLDVLVWVLVPSFLALGYWQLQRAMSGNALSWAYALEWPFFAGYLIYVWLRIRRHGLAKRPKDDPSGRVVDTQRAADDPALEEEDDDDLRAYNEYLRWLASSKGK